MNLVKDIQSLPPAQWLTRKAIIFDWYDGPREGVCALAQPGVEFSFELLDERSNANDLDDRLFRLKELPAGSVDGIWASLAELAPPDQAFWVPLWEFPNEIKQQEADKHVQETLGRARATPVDIATRDMRHFLGCWTTEINTNVDQGWFSALEISQKP